MRIKMSSATTLLATVGVAAAIAAAPVAGAAVPDAVTAGCSSATPGTECVVPGNAQLNDSIEPDFAPQYPDFSLFGLGRSDEGRGGHR
jgi:hypothetical protein